MRLAETGTALRAPQFSRASGFDSDESEIRHRLPTVTDEVVLEAARIRSAARDSIDIEVDFEEPESAVGDEEIVEVRPPPTPPRPSGR